MVERQQPLWLESVQAGWNLFTRQPVPFLLATLIYGIAASALRGATNYALEHFGWVVELVLLGPCLGGIASMVGQVRQNEAVDLNVAFAPWQRAGDYLVVGLAVAAGVIVLLVGVLATFTLFVFAPMLVVEGEGYASALGQSRDLVIRHYREVLPLCGVIVLASILAVFATFSLGLLFVVPVAVASVCELLTRLRALPPPSAAATPSEDPSAEGETAEVAPADDTASSNGEADGGVVRGGND